jgi:hypothetical protein
MKEEKTGPVFRKNHLFIRWDFTSFSQIPLVVNSENPCYHAKAKTIFKLFLTEH